VFFTTPRLAVQSPERGSGKTRLLELIAMLVPNSALLVNITNATFFREIRTKTLLIDEIDALYGGSTAERYEELRAALNAGYREGAGVPRVFRECVITYPVFGPVVLAGIDRLPPTIQDRSIVVTMHKRLPHEHVEEFNFEKVEERAEAVAKELLGWIERNFGEIRTTRPSMPSGIVDRYAELWRPLLTVAEVAGSPWQVRSRDAALALLAERAADTTPQVALLGDVEAVMYANRTKPLARIPSGDLVEALLALPEAPHRRAHLDQAVLAKTLGKFGIKSVNLKVGRRVVKGYKRDAAMEEAFARYTRPNTQSERRPIDGCDH